MRALWIGLLTCLTMAGAGSPLGASPDRPSLQELRQAPEQAQMDGCQVRLERTYVWRDFMPTFHGPPETPNGLLATLTLTALGQSLPAGLKVLAVCIVQEDKIWVSTQPEVHADATRLQAVVRGGPAWEVGSDVEVIVQLGCGDRQFLIREPSTPINRTD